jgi:hypothetical protein
MKSAWSAWAPAHQVVYLEDQPLCIEVAESLGIRGIRHTDHRSTCAQLAAFGLQPDEGVIHETSQPMHLNDQWRLVEH